MILTNFDHSIIEIISLKFVNISESFLFKFQDRFIFDLSFFHYIKSSKHYKVPGNRAELAGILSGT